MTRAKPPARPGNDHDDRPDFLDDLERGVLNVVLPLGVAMGVGAVIGLIWAEVS